MEAFELFDSNSDGYITETDLRRTLRVLGFHHLTHQDVSEMMAAADQNGDNHLDYGEVLLRGPELCQLFASRCLHHPPSPSNTLHL